MADESLAGTKPTGKFRPDLFELLLMVLLLIVKIFGMTRRRPDPAA